MKNNNNNYCLARKYLILTILIVKLGEEVFKLLSMVNNYLNFHPSRRYALL